MKNVFIIIFLFLGIISGNHAQNNILEARGMPEGTEVTVKGIVTNGSEFGIIRYFQDETAGIAAYGSAIENTNRGDTITVTGILKNYNQLLELDPISSVEVNSSGNPSPEPILLTPNQISEPYEGMLVKVNDVLFNDAGLLFTGNNKYEFTANGQTGYVYVKNGQNIVGTVIPTGEVNVTAICSQYHYSNPNDGYQLLMRDLDDINNTSSIFLTGTLVNTEFTYTSLDFSWITNIEGTTEMFYGSTESSVNTNHITSTGVNTNHTISISGLSAGEITWVQAFSVNGIDTAKSALSSYATISNSSGEMIAYFNTPVDVSYSNGVDAIYLHETMDDTLIQYINRAKYTIDFTIYNFNNTGISNISDALIAAADRGVRVRVIGCGTTLNLGIDELEGTACHVLIGPDDSQRDGIMHNKFIIFDAQSSDQNEPLVWTGSTNLTDGQINVDANNVIIVQDQSLARAYQIEFEEMWGSAGDEPDPAKALFGSAKRNNTPREFMIGGKYVECFFSPSGGVNSKIVDVINTADNDLSVATMLITRTEMANAIADQKAAGVAVNVITNDESGNSTTVNQILQNALSTHNTFDIVTNGLLHHKFMIVDQYAPSMDPIVFTGSHNWSASADNNNDENTLVIHDATLANIYYQQFVKRFVDNLGVLIELTDPPTAVNDSVETGIEQKITVSVLENDIMQAPVTLEIVQQATQGVSEIPFSNLNVIDYTPDDGYIGLDSVVYKITYTADETLFSTATVYIDVVDGSGIGDIEGISCLSVYPNPVKDQFNLSFYATENTVIRMIICDLAGKEFLLQELNVQSGNNQFTIQNHKLAGGVYLLKLSHQSVSSYTKLIVR